MTHLCKSEIKGNCCGKCHSTDLADDERYNSGGIPDINGAYDAGGHYYMQKDVEAAEVQMDNMNDR